MIVIIPLVGRWIGALHPGLIGTCGDNGNAMMYETSINLKLERVLTCTQWLEAQHTARKLGLHPCHNMITVIF